MAVAEDAAAEIIAQVPQPGKNAQGDIEQGYKVSFVTAKGVNGSVFVPNSQFTVDYVKEQVGLQARLLDSVQGLQVP